MGTSKSTQDKKLTKQIADNYKTYNNPVLVAQILSDKIYYSNSLNQSNFMSSVEAVIDIMEQHYDVKLTLLRNQFLRMYLILFADKLLAKAKQLDCKNNNK